MTPRITVVGDTENYSSYSVTGKHKSCEAKFVGRTFDLQ